MNDLSGQYHLRDSIRIFLSGVVMGIVEIIPGVSGGTLALVLGIYDRFIGAINAFFSWLLSIPARLGGGRRNGSEGFASASDAQTGGGAAGSRIQRDRVPWRFLILLGAGTVVGIASFSHVIGVGLDRAPGAMLAVFFGVVVASVPVPLRMLPRIDWRALLALVVAAIGSYLLLGAPAADRADISTWYLFVSGVVAMSVMVLPGVSGSFMLLVLGSYGYVLSMVRRVSSGMISMPLFLELAVLGLGLAVGIGGAARLLRLLLTRYRAPTLGALAGLMIGSLRRLWPFIEDAPVGTSIDRIAKLTLREIVALPGPEVAVRLLLVGIGAIAIIGLTWLSKRTGTDAIERKARAS